MPPDDAMVERGELDAASAVLEESQMPEDIPDFTLFVPLLFSRGKLRVARGEREAGLRDLLLCGERARAWDRGTRCSSRGGHTRRACSTLVEIGRRPRAWWRRT